MLHVDWVDTCIVSTYDWIFLRPSPSGFWPNKTHRKHCWHADKCWNLPTSAAEIARCPQTIGKDQMCHPEQRLSFICRNNNESKHFDSDLFDNFINFEQDGISIVNTIFKKLWTYRVAPNFLRFKSAAWLTVITLIGKTLADFTGQQSATCCLHGHISPGFLPHRHLASHHPACSCHQPRQ